MRLEGGHLPKVRTIRHERKLYPEAERTGELPTRAGLPQPLREVCAAWGRGRALDSCRETRGHSASLFQALIQAEATSFKKEVTKQNKKNLTNANNNNPTRFVFFAVASIFIDFHSAKLRLCAPGRGDCQTLVTAGSGWGITLWFSGPDPPPPNQPTTSRAQPSLRKTRGHY